MEIRDQVIERIRKVGFKKVVIDEEGLLSGKMNRAAGIAGKL